MHFLHSLFSFSHTIRNASLFDFKLFTINHYTRLITNLHTTDGIRVENRMRHTYILADDAKLQTSKFTLHDTKMPFQCVLSSFTFSIPKCLVIVRVIGKLLIHSKRR